jgi:anaerobic magnesium-protoporphyrin IX monomethyl ester cyclase
MPDPTIHLVSIAAPFRMGMADMKRPPSALLYVGGFLKQHGFHVRVHHVSESQIPALTADIVNDAHVLFVGFSIITGVPVASSHEASRIIKEHRPKIPVIWGGIHPSIMPEKCLQDSPVDYVVIGEGENTVLELTNFLLQGGRGDLRRIQGLAFKSATGVVITPPRDFERDIDLFRQDWSLVDIKKYVRDDRSFYFITSRGCPHNCGFCYNQQFNKRRWRAHSPEFVVRELAAIQQATGIRQVIFDDDNFFTDPRRGLEIIRRLQEIGIRCQWVEIRCDYITEPLVRELAAAGVEKLFIGWESGSPETLERISKGIDRKCIEEAFRIIGRHKSLQVDASAIIGFPWEKRKNIRQTVRLALKLFRSMPFRIQFNLGTYVPYPGSPILHETLPWRFTFPAAPDGWRGYDILNGRMAFPWADARRIRNFQRIDRYAKLLFMPRHSSRKRYILVLLAYVRLLLGVYAVPFELWRESRLALRTAKEAC